MKTYKSTTINILRTFTAVVGEITLKGSYAVDASGNIVNCNIEAYGAPEGTVSPGGALLLGSLSPNNGRKVYTFPDGIDPSESMNELSEVYQSILAEVSESQKQ